MHDYYSVEGGFVNCPPDNEFGPEYGPPPCASVVVGQSILWVGLPVLTVSLLSAFGFVRATIGRETRPKWVSAIFAPLIGAFTVTALQVVPSSITFGLALALGDLPWVLIASTVAAYIVFGIYCLLHDILNRWVSVNPAQELLLGAALPPTVVLVLLILYHPEPIWWSYWEHWWQIFSLATAGAVAARFHGSFNRRAGHSKES